MEVRIVQLEEFFKNVDLIEKVDLDKCTKIVNPQLFVETHLAVVKNYKDNERYLLYLERLEKLKELLS